LSHLPLASLGGDSDKHHSPHSARRCRFESDSLPLMSTLALRSKVVPFTARCEINWRHFQAADLIGFSGYNPGSAAINLVTVGVPFWSLSHVAIVGQYRGRKVLFESTTLNDQPCLITGRRIKGVQCHDIASRVADYRGAVWHYPLTRPLFEHELVRLQEFLNSKVGLPYNDIGAVRVGGIILPLIENYLSEESRSSLFCSELCAAAYNRIGIFPTAYCGRWSPNHLARQMSRYGLFHKPVRLK
jgi:hypothetical protein